MQSDTAVESGESGSSMWDVLVVGAGMAGLSCAERLQQAGLQVLVVDKSRGVGGRLSTRRVETSAGVVGLDHGAQYITASSDSFRRFIQQQVKLGTMVEWGRNLHIFENGRLREGGLDERRARFCCPDGMTAVAKQMAAGLQVEPGVRVRAVRSTGSGWVVEVENGDHHSAQSVVMTLPAPQILELLSGWLEEDMPLYGPLQSAEYWPCIAVMAGYGSEVTPPVWQGVKWQGDGQVMWTALDSSKRSQPLPPRVVIHSTPEFACEHLQDEADRLEAAGQRLLKHVAAQLGDWLGQPEWMQVHRWRYSLPIELVGLMSLGMMVSAEDGEARWPLVCGGDWCAGAKVEGAFLSGCDAGDRLLSMLEKM